MQKHISTNTNANMTPLAPNRLLGIPKPRVVRAQSWPLTDADKAAFDAAAAKRARKNAARIAQRDAMNRNLGA